jgi:hypothetical protein
MNNKYSNVDDDGNDEMKDDSYNDNYDFLMANSNGSSLKNTPKSKNNLNSYLQRSNEDDLI